MDTTQMERTKIPAATNTAKSANGFVEPPIGTQHNVKSTACEEIL
jgi:hypothetical protein